MPTFQEFASTRWRALSGSARLLLAGSLLIIIAMLVWGIYSLVHEDYRTLFSQLSDADAASLVEALKRQKIPYRLADGGSTINVPAERVHEIRLSLMAGNVPLSGGVGFELFDKQGLGVTEQSERVTFQRALQGELARTIAALDNVKQARVHLVMPESSLFKRDRQEASAAVALTLKPGSVLERQQIAGVQKLVAASVPGLEASHVVVTDQRGILLSNADADSGGASSLESRLDVQRQVEAYISQKVAHLLDRAIGPGKALISVNVALSFDAIKTTTQDLLPVHGAPNATENGIVRRRQTQSGTSGDLHAQDIGAAASGTGRQNSTVEVEYEYGHRVEEVVAAPGAVRRMSIGIIVPAEETDEQQRRIRELVLAAAGLDIARGDSLSVEALGKNIDSTPPESNPLAANDTESATEGAVSHPIALHHPLDQPWQMPVAIAIGSLIVLALLLMLRRNGTARTLSDTEREALLREIRTVMGEPTTTAGPQVRSK